MVSEPAGVLWPLSALNAVATVLKDPTVCVWGGAIVRKVTRLPSPGDNDRVELVGSAGEAFPTEPVENAGSGTLATVMYCCCTVRSQVAFMFVASRLATRLCYTFCC